MAKKPDQKPEWLDESDDDEIDAVLGNLPEIATVKDAAPGPAEPRPAAKTAPAPAPSSAHQELADLEAQRADMKRRVTLGEPLDGAAFARVKTRIAELKRQLGVE